MASVDDPPAGLPPQDDGQPGAELAPARGQPTTRSRRRQRSQAAADQARYLAGGVDPRTLRATAAGRPPEPKPRLEYQALGAPPDDPLARIHWTHRALSISLFHVLNDKSLDERQRRKEMREVARVMNELLPRDRLYEAERTARGEDAAMREAHTGPELENAEGLPSAGGGSPPRRGRPAKRTLV